MYLDYGIELGDGWYHLEGIGDQKEYRWTNIFADIRINDKFNQKKSSIELEIFDNTGRYVEVVYSSQKSYRFKLKDGWNVYQIPIYAMEFEESLNIQFNILPTNSPSIIKDSRVLGIKCCAIKFGTGVVEFDGVTDVTFVFISDLHISKICDIISWYKYNGIFNIKLFSSHDIDIDELIKINPLLSEDDVFNFIETELYKYIETKFVIINYWDSFVVDFNFWDSNFLNFDYICSSGICFRSRHYLENNSDKDIKFNIAQDYNESGFCNSQKYDGEFAFNGFVNSNLPSSAKLIYQNKFYIEGSYSDVMYFLPFIKNKGGGILFLNKSNRFIFNLLKTFSYIYEIIEVENCPLDIDYNLTSMTVENDLYIHPWGHPSSKIINLKFPIIINRTIKEKTKFPWESILKSYRDKLLFVGTKVEYLDFYEKYGKTSFHESKNLIEIYSMLYGCKLFIGNDSFLYSMIESLKKPAICEEYVSFERYNLYCIDDDYKLLYKTIKLNIERFLNE